MCPKPRSACFAAGAPPWSLERHGRAGRRRPSRLGRTRRWSRSRCPSRPAARAAIPRDIPTTCRRRPAARTDSREETQSGQASKQVGYWGQGVPFHRSRTAATAPRPTPGQLRHAAPQARAASCLRQAGQGREYLEEPRKSGSTCSKRI